MRGFLAAACMAVFGLAQPVAAATFSTFTNDLTFNAICGEGGFDLACESAVAELRNGSFDTSGTFERALRSPTEANTFGNSSEGQFAWQSGVGVPFSVFHNGSQVITLTVGGLSIQIDMAQDLANDPDTLPYSEVTSMFIRTRQPDPTNGDSATLTNLVLSDVNGPVQTIDAGTLQPAPLPNNAPTGGGFANTSYIKISNFDWQAVWTLSGTTTFTFPNGTAGFSGSAFDHTFKLTNVAADVPLPASAWLLLGGVAALSLARRRVLKTA